LMGAYEERAHSQQRNRLPSIPYTEIRGQRR
jgi:hypothetical protein